MGGIPIVYLDSNVVVGMCDGRLPDLKSEILKSSRNQSALFPFTADTVSEVALKIDSKEEAMKRLAFLTEVSRELYFERSAFDFRFVRRDAFQVYDTLAAVSVGLDAAATFRGLVSYEDHKFTAKAYSMDPAVMNNFPPERLFDYINQKLGDYEYLAGSEEYAPRDVEQVLELIESFCMRQNGPFWSKHNYDPEQMMRGFKHIALFTLLDSFGYCRDKRREYEKGSAFADSSHTFLASYCDFLVSSDMRMRKRAVAVFWYLGHKTRTVTPGELLRIMNSR